MHSLEILLPRARLGSCRSPHLLVTLHVQPHPAQEVIIPSQFLPATLPSNSGTQHSLQLELQCIHTECHPRLSPACLITHRRSQTLEEEAGPFSPLKPLGFESKGKIQMPVTSSKTSVTAYTKLLEWLQEGGFFFLLSALTLNNN